MDYKDISSEDWREYVYPDGFVYRINGPNKLYIKSKPEGDSHRVTNFNPDTQDEVTHYVPAGWRIIRWFAPKEPVSF